MLNLKGLLLILTLLFFIKDGLTQEKRCNWGHLSGSIESSMGVYFKDDKLGIKEVENHFGTNTFLNLNYNLNQFRFGLNYELFEPPMIGYSSLLEGNKLIGGFASWSNSSIGIRLGSCYEQLGSGLLFRAYEDRALAFNSSFLGANIQWKINDVLAIKAFAGVPRKYLDYADSKIFGSDIELYLNKMFNGEANYSLSIGGSWCLRDDESKEKIKDSFSVIRGYATRVNFSKDAFSLSGEYVNKSNSQVFSEASGFIPMNGEAFLLNFGLNFSGFGFSLECRTVKNMDMWIDEESSDDKIKLNYIPSLTRQHKYKLLSLFPHEIKELGEIGGQFDLFGELFPTRNYPLRFSLNGSLFRKLESDGDKYYLFKTKGDHLFSELGLELERRWGKSIKTTLCAAWQKKAEFSRYGFGKQLMNTQIVVADILYKLTRRTSARFELQHAWSDSKDDQAWWMALLELGFAPHWMLYASNMSNYESYKSSINYYDIGGSFTWKTFRGSISYGRNRAGINCSGGICRYIPEYSGLNISLSLTL